MGKVKHSKTKSKPSSRPNNHQSAIDSSLSRNYLVEITSLDANRRLRACLLLANICSINSENSDALEKIAKAELVSKLLMRLVDSNMEVRVETANIFATLANSGSDIIMDRLLQVGVLQTLISLFLENCTTSCSSPLFVERILTTLTKFCFQNETCARDISNNQELMKVCFGVFVSDLFGLDVRLAACELFLILTDSNQPLCLFIYQSSYLDNLLSLATQDPATFINDEFYYRNILFLLRILGIIQNIFGMVFLQYPDSFQRCQISNVLSRLVTLLSMQSQEIPVFCQQEMTAYLEFFNSTQTEKSRSNSMDSDLSDVNSPLDEEISRKRSRREAVLGPFDVIQLTIEIVTNMASLLRDLETTGEDVDDTSMLDEDADDESLESSSSNSNDINNNTNNHNPNAVNDRNWQKDNLPMAAQLMLNEFASQQIFLVLAKSLASFIYPNYALSLSQIVGNSNPLVDMNNKDASGSGSGSSNSYPNDGNDRRNENAWPATPCWIDLFLSLERCSTALMNFLAFPPSLLAIPVDHPIFIQAFQDAFTFLYQAMEHSSPYLLLSTSSSSSSSSSSNTSSSSTSSWQVQSPRWKVCPDMDEKKLSKAVLFAGRAFMEGLKTWSENDHLHLSSILAACPTLLRLWQGSVMEFPWIEIVIPGIEGLGRLFQSGHGETELCLTLTQALLLRLRSPHGLSFLSPMKMKQEESALFALEVMEACYQALLDMHSSDQESYFRGYLSLGVKDVLKETLVTFTTQVKSKSLTLPKKMLGKYKETILNVKRFLKYKDDFLRQYPQFLMKN